MANIKKLNYEKGDKTNTTSHPNTCPNGHALAVRANRQRGNGRVYCPTCGWSDGNSVTATDPATPVSSPRVASRSCHSEGASRGGSRMSSVADAEVDLKSKVTPEQRNISARLLHEKIARGEVALGPPGHSADPGPHEPIEDIRDQRDPAVSLASLLT
jgi:hypothetical protein